jgi:type I restriction enzyme, R subunit
MAVTQNSGWSLFERKPLHERLMSKTRDFIQKFYADM